MTENCPPIAHRSGVACHLLIDHLQGTENLAARFASAWGAEGPARLAGLWHDLGKYSPEFQAMIRAEDVDANIEGIRRRVIHSTAGALWAQRTQPELGLLLAYVIAGHHGGLPDWSGNGLERRLRDGELLDRALVGAPPLAVLDHAALPRPQGIDLSLWIRMLGSAVFDADFLNTEAFFDPERKVGRFGWPKVADLLPRLDATLARRFDDVVPTPVNLIRADVLAACRQAAQRPPGLYQLTVPTGGGKTLSSLAFALAHAAIHGLERVVYAAPFTSIIDQTAQVFRDAVGDDAVLEHHSALAPSPEGETARSRLASENWDAPLVVTTTVQLFESLFANRTSQVRKLHNLAHSVIVLDEAQALPPAVLRPVTAVLDQLVRHYGTTVVLCTATQPSLARVFPGFTPQEIAPEPDRLFTALDRVDIQLPEPARQVSWTDLANRMADEPRSLTIVNTRADCRALYRLLPAGSIHLSTLQCARHRARLLAEIKQRTQGRLHVASTSLVEAGVDIDFPAVFRAMAGLDSLAQAAGRCNRNGAPVKGRFTVFRPAETSSERHVAQMIEAAERALATHAATPFQPQAFDTYFSELYWARGDAALDAFDMGRLLGLGARRREGMPWAFAFRTAAEAFRMIDDTRDTIVVPYPGAEDGLAALRRDGPERSILRALQSFTVAVPRDGMTRLKAAGALEECGGITLLKESGCYRDDIGLDWEDL